jgi:hypothetical protein
MLMRYFVLTALLALTLVGAASCRTGGLALKQQATTALTAGETALTQARVNELTLFNSHTVPAYTVALHQRFLSQLATAQRLEIAASKALQDWVPDKGVPTDVTALVKAVQAIVTLIESLNAPAATASTLAPARTALAHAKATAKSLGGK